MSDSVQVVCPHCEAINRIPRCPARRRSALLGNCKQALFEGKPIPVSEAGFRRQLASSGIPLLVDFWASWCGPCHAMAPQFEAAARELEPGMRLLKVSTEEAERLAAELRVSSIPTLALFAGGHEVARQAGAIPARRIVEWARAHAPQ